ARGDSDPAGHERPGRHCRRETLWAAGERAARRGSGLHRARPASSRRGRAPRCRGCRGASGASLRPASHALPRRGRNLAGELLGVHLARGRRSAGARGGRARRRPLMGPGEPRDPFVSPRFGQLATFMLLPAADSPRDLDVALVGVPYDGGTSYRAGARFGPRAVREQSSLIRTWHPVLKVHPFQRLRVADCGDVDVVPISIERTYEAVTRKLDAVLA